MAGGIGINYVIVEQGELPPDLDSEVKRILRLEEYRAMQQVLGATQNFWRSKAPVKTGRYKMSIKQEIEREHPEAIGADRGGFVGSVVKYDRKAEWIEEGVGKFGPRHQPIRAINHKFLRIPARDLRRVRPENYPKWQRKFRQRALLIREVKGYKGKHIAAVVAKYMYTDALKEQSDAGLRAVRDINALLKKYDTKVRFRAGRSVISL